MACSGSLSLFVYDERIQPIIINLSRRLPFWKQPLYKKCGGNLMSYRGQASLECGCRSCLGPAGSRGSLRSCRGPIEAVPESQRILTRFAARSRPSGHQARTNKKSDQQTMPEFSTSIVGNMWAKWKHPLWISRRRRCVH